MSASDSVCYGTTAKGRLENGEVPSAVHEALSGAADVRDVRWHFKVDFDALNEDRWAEEPNKGSAEKQRG